MMDPIKMPSEKAVLSKKIRKIFFRFFLKLLWLEMELFVLNN